MRAKQTAKSIMYCVLRTAFNILRNVQHVSPKRTYRLRITYHASRITLYALLLTACGQTGSAPPPTQPPLPGSLETVVIPIREDPPGFNAYLTDTGYEELMGELMYEGLAEMAPDGGFMPSWLWKPPPEKTAVSRRMD